MGERCRQESINGAPAVYNRPMEKKNDFWPYAAFILLSLLVGGLATLVSVDGMRAFQDLPQSPLTPPPVVFSIVWSILYVLMGVSAALIYGVEPRGLKDQHLLYAGTLLLNFLWPVLFFALELRLAALVVLLMMIALAIGTVVRYRPVSRPAAYLQIPYALRLLFAFYLNLTAYQLNG